MIHRTCGQDRLSATFPQVDMGIGGGHDKQPPPIRPSGRQDLNLRPLDPQSSALPSCATSRPPPKEPGQLSARAMRAHDPRVGRTGGHDVTAQLPRSVLTGHEADGRMSTSKIAVGRYNEQQAFGMSTAPLTRPSIGAAPRIR
jgi:hypothetical protein